MSPTRFVASAVIRSTSLVSTSTRLVSRRSSASSWSSRVSAVAGAVGRPLPGPLATSAPRSSWIWRSSTSRSARTSPRFGPALCAAAPSASAAATASPSASRRIAPAHRRPSAHTPGPDTTVTARRFCDQQLSSAQVATGRARPKVLVPIRLSGMPRLTM